MVFKFEQENLTLFKKVSLTLSTVYDFSKSVFLKDIISSSDGHVPCRQRRHYKANAIYNCVIVSKLTISNKKD